VNTGYQGLIPAATPQIKPFSVTRHDDPSTLKNSRRLEMESHVYLAQHTLSTSDIRDGFRLWLIKIQITLDI
jgi:hypothetical protein